MPRKRKDAKPPKRKTKPKHDNTPQNDKTIPPEQREAVSAATAGQLLGLGESTIRAHCYARNLESVRLGVRLRVPMSEVRRAAREGLPSLPVVRSKKAASAAADQPQAEAA